MSFINAAKQERARMAKSDEHMRSMVITRYVFTPYNDLVIPALNSMGGIIPKGIIVPIYRPFKQINWHREGLDGDNLDKMQFDIIKDPLTRKGTHQARQYFSPADVVDWIGTEYVNSGGVEIKALAGMDVEEFEKLQLNKILLGVEDEVDFVTFPTAEGYEKQFGKVREGLVGMEAKYPDQAKMLRQALEEIEQAVRVAVTNARADAEQANNEMAAGDIRRFTPGHLYAFQFSGVTKRDEALNDLAKLQNEAARNALTAPPAPAFDVPAFMAGMMEMVKAMGQQQAESTTKAIQEALKAAQKPAEPEPVVVPEAAIPAPAKRRSPYASNE